MLFYNRVFAYLSLQRFLQRDRRLVLAMHYFPPFLQPGSLGVKTRLARCPAVYHVLSGATGSIEPVSTQLSFLASGGGRGVENLISGHFHSF